ncbi:MAG: hypothetical protein F6J98_09720 [Moorea sp. SIO4G2]|uniref:hypothetical protein n=1 Tax=unclassified Moorena TaxID=2683338 RepID=UPI0013FCCDA0|nr:MULTISPECIES: hypothetical protein [unclassified Moorena]NEO15883.1 hypothetical protein [Moorena sp. SIO3E8]NEO60690.1 hypothetical protein [Moorena sp. SIO4G2]NEQ02300.1 hypothetical protein [Moorena sp. SIO3F7]
MGRWGDGEMGRWGDGGILTGVGFLHLGKTWDDPEGEEKENNEQAMQRRPAGETTPVAHGGNPQDRTGSPRPRCIAFLSPTPQTPNPTPHTFSYQPMRYLRCYCSRSTSSSAIGAFE